MEDEPTVTNSPPHQPHIYRPIPRRNWSQNSHNASNAIEPLSPMSPTRPSRVSSSSDFLNQLNARLLGARNPSSASIQDGWNEGGSLAASSGHNKSFLNMTSSTLFGIYDDVSAPSTALDTPWGTGAETPARERANMLDAWNGNGDANGNGSGAPDAGLAMKLRARHSLQTIPQPSSNRLQRSHRSKQTRTHPVAIAAKIVALFLFGVTYGAIVSLLHDTRELAPVRVGGFNHRRWLYFATWGVAGVVLGSLLPYVDFWWDGTGEDEEESKVSVRRDESAVGEQWNQVVRSVGAFVGIAYAIRKLPWQSTLQLTFTLALVNPALWYLLDRSKTGLTVSTLFSSLLTSILLFSNPDVLPSPAVAHPTYSSPAAGGVHHGGQEELFAGVVSYDSLAVATWVGSVLFCSCVCFGSIGRRLGVLKEWR